MVLSYQLFQTTKECTDQDSSPFSNIYTYTDIYIYAHIRTPLKGGSNISVTCSNWKTRFTLHQGFLYNTFTIFLHIKRGQSYVGLPSYIKKWRKKKVTEHILILIWDFWKNKRTNFEKKILTTPFRPLDSWSFLNKGTPLDRIIHDAHFGTKGTRESGSTRI